MKTCRKCGEEFDEGDDEHNPVTELGDMFSETMGEPAVMTFARSAVSDQASSPCWRSTYESFGLAQTLSTAIQRLAQKLH